MVQGLKTLSNITRSQYLLSFRYISGCLLALTTVHLTIHPASVESLFEFLYMAIQDILKNQLVCGFITGRSSAKCAQNRQTSVVVGFLVQRFWSLEDVTVDIQEFVLLYSVTVENKPASLY